ncbi:MAG TPA: cupin domain-containing protein [Candidatus Aerophobetes bacterium]|uniref:Cupin domain-containing protein n=1 Tax=Aerophobetes bacterium TaxID=2030807 RepID=A0A7V5HYB0_UNCAE|nr:cupin domain-containing protein [Candidatus Aerophobetes bacterium]
MGKVHRFYEKEGKFFWEEVREESYNSEEAKSVTKKVLIGEKEGAPYFVIRYFEVEPGGWTFLHSHPHDHGVFILKGKGKVLLGEEEIDVKFGDVIYIPPHEKHRLKNTGDTPFGFLCVIPNKKLL